MGYPAFVIPLILAAEFNTIADGERRDARRTIDVVRDQNTLSRSQAHDEALMPRTLSVVAQYSIDNACALCLEEPVVAACGRRRNVRFRGSFACTLTDRYWRTADSR
jgi:hypothetical protein